MAVYELYTKDFGLGEGSADFYGEGRGLAGSGLLESDFVIDDGL